MKYIKKFEGFDRPINIGDKVIWIHPNAHQSTIPKSRDVKYGDICEITERKNKYGVLYIRARNLENKRIICFVYDEGMRRTSYTTKGHWIEFDEYFTHELDHDIKKYNI